ncbi:uncharacterized protein LOC115924967 [Strongylocentrotus purpuratus]|uniref:Uncharacterized protein n=1 Tax=Strongylocentrotus purpuratus TaxID=7668 RepID=A0A7M7T021_STRPU|nr:uncharacterized protein LOC115924967 [Strongylocentrotus purpuratus]
MDELVQRLHACTCLADVSALRDELYEDLEPNHHCLIFAKITYYLGQEETLDTNSTDHAVDGRPAQRSSTSIGQPRVHVTIRDYMQGRPSTSRLPSAKQQPVA